MILGKNAEEITEYITQETAGVSGKEMIWEAPEETVKDMSEDIRGELLENF